jgi:hypothetical protein
VAKVNGLSNLSVVELKDLRTRVDAALVERQVIDKAEVARKLEAFALSSGYS